MAANYKPASDNQFNKSTSGGGTAIDFRGYSKVYVHIVVISISGTPELKLQTSNIGGTDDGDWIDVYDFGEVSADTSYGVYLPRGAADDEGFGRYLRIYHTCSSESISYKVYYEAKE